MSTDVRALAIQLAAIKTVIDAAKLAETEVKRRLQGALDPGDRKTATVDGVSVGTITYAKTSPTAVVSDRATFTAWVRDNHPTEFHRECTIDASVCARVLEGEPLTPDDQSALEDGVRYAYDVVAPTFERDTLARALADREPVDRDTGEQIPGITYRPGGEGKYVSCRQDLAQYDALVAAYKAGTVDLLALTMSVPQLAVDEGAAV